VREAEVLQELVLQQRLQQLCGRCSDLCCCSFLRLQQWLQQLQQLRSPRPSLLRALRQWLRLRCGCSDLRRCCSLVRSSGSDLWRCCSDLCGSGCCPDLRCRSHLRCCSFVRQQRRLQQLQ
jgi:hypothetical protein